MLLYMLTLCFSSSLGERVQQEGKDTVRFLGSTGNREMTFCVGKVSVDDLKNKEYLCD
jgi:hypothetical protein